MCGIVGLFLKDPHLEPELGTLVAGMLGTLCDRGPDSAGFAIYGSETPGAIKLTLRDRVVLFRAGRRRLRRPENFPLNRQGGWTPKAPKGRLSWRPPRWNERYGGIRVSNFVQTAAGNGRRLRS